MDGYELVALLKTGGQGEVWRALAPDGGEVAVKVMQIAKGFDGETSQRELKRFLREIETQRTLDHSGIVKVLDSGPGEDRPWYAMELAEGSLRDLFVMNPDGMDEDQAIVMFQGIMDAIVYSHREGAIHRDLKPENVLLFGGQPRLSDYGLTRRLHSGSSTITIADGLGSMKYAAPEQLEDGHTVDERADIYSLGCIVFEMLTGRPFFPHRNLQLAPQKFRGLIHKATELDQTARYSSTVEMSKAFKMLSADIDRLQSPSSRAEALITPISAGRYQESDVAALAQILIQYSDDAQLYHYAFSKANSVALNALAKHESAAFKQIVRALATLSENASFDWDHVDLLGRFFCDAIKATDDVDAKIALFRTLLTVATSHNRYRVRTMWIRSAQETMTDPTYAPIIADLIRSMPECKEFLRAEMAAVSLPPIVAEELAA